MAETSRRKPRGQRPEASADLTPTNPSTNELLQELDRRNIRYSPTATRKELEHLLQSKSSRKISPEAPESRISGDGSHEKDVAILVRELLSKGVRLPPHASRADLQRLVDEQRQSTKEKVDGIQKGSRPIGRRYKHKAIPRLLKELDDLGIPYPEDASPAALEKLLRSYEDDEELIGTPIPTRRRRRPRRDDHPPSAKTQFVPDSDGNESKSTAELLIELNRRGIRFPPTATRRDLEALLTEQNRYKRFSSKRPSVDESDPFVLDPEREKMVSKAVHPDFEGDNCDRIRNPKRRTAKRRKRKMESSRSLWSKLYGTSKKTFQHGVFQTIPNYVSRTSSGATTRLSQAAEKAARKARQATRSAGNFFAEDEDGVRDVDFQYVSKDIPIDVPAVPVVEERQRRSPRNMREQHFDSTPKRTAPRTKMHDVNEESMFVARRRRNMASFQSMSRSPSGSRPVRSRKGSEDTTLKVPKSSLATESNLFRLPPAKDSDINNATEEKSSSRSKSKSKKLKSRRIYSPYDEQDLPSQVYRDSIDRLADFLVSTTDNILWGPLEDDDKSVLKSGSPKKKRPKRRTSESPVKDQISWRDRVEERFDSMLGIHENGEYYNRWAREEEQGEFEVTGTDALSYARGQTPKKKKRLSRKGKVHDKPFWEVENAISSLFGRTPPTGYSGIGFGKIGNLLPILKTVTKSLIVMAGNACEWATVRGSLPQPVVVVGITSCALSARPGKRLLALAISLFAFRIFGELIHEGLYGDLDWDEDEEEIDDDELVD